LAPIPEVSGDADKRGSSVTARHANAGGGLGTEHHFGRMRTISSQFRVFVIPAHSQWRATVLATVVGALIFFVYEASKSAIFPGLTIWESHSITIGFGSVIAGGAAWFAMRRQARLLQAIASEEALRERLEMRQRALAESESRFRQLVEQSPEAIAVHRRGYLIYVNGAGVALIGADTSSALVGRRAADFLHPNDTVLAQQRRAGTSRLQYRLVRTDGELREVEAVSVPIEYEGADAVQTVFRDITERKALEARLRHEAFHDGLTGLANRALFRDRLEHALMLSRRQAGVELAVLFLDLDDFKGINDSLGHEAGDRVLQAVANRIREETRGADTVARFGGDEFAILLEGVPSEMEALAIVTRIKGALRKPLMIDGRLMTIAASIGIAFGRSGNDVESLLRNADVAMYEAKEAGKARYAVFEPAMYEAIVQRLQLESDLRAAVLSPTEAGMYLVYQPIVDLVTGETRSLEALLRWHHTEQGALPPSLFVPIAEHTGAIVPLGRWILETVCSQIMEWRTLWWRERLDPTGFPSVSVNISGRQLREEHFVEEVEEILRQTGVPASAVTLEITESVIMHDSEQSLRTLSALKALGLRLAIDDFGTGYSSLSYLQRFPVDILKIDRAFVEGVATEGSDAALARTIVSLGTTLTLHTVAEGVEVESQRVALRQMGCQLGQGYLFSPPMPAQHVLPWLVPSMASTARAVTSM
jgi:diguanylate cyclase (GGDEF)-like protein/PAS domain S-box-containing protein